MIDPTKDKDFNAALKRALKMPHSPHVPKKKAAKKAKRPAAKASPKAKKDD
jgi:hypothetical protein